MSAINAAVAAGGAYLSNKGSKAAGEAAGDAADAAYAAEMAKLDYLKESEKIPRQYREGGLTALGENYGLVFDEDGNPIDQGSIMDRAMASPFYRTAVEKGEQSILRNAAATGGLRSGNVQDALYDANTAALNLAYQDQLGGLNSLAFNIPSNTNAIGNAIAAPGMTQALGIQAQGQAQQAGYQGLANSLGSGFENYMKYKK